MIFIKDMGEVKIVLKDELRKLKEMRKGLKDILKLEYDTALLNVIVAIEKANILEEAAAEKKE